MNALLIPDDARACRLQLVPLRRRTLAFLWRAGWGALISGWLASVQIANNVRGPEWLWTVGIFAFGLVMGFRAWRRRELKVYDTVLIHYTLRQRLTRAAKWFVPGVGMIGFIWWIQILEDQLQDYWWYAWPALLPVIVGLGLFLLRAERVLSGPGLLSPTEN